MVKFLKEKQKFGGLWARLAVFAVVLMMTTANGRLTAQTVVNSETELNTAIGSVASGGTIQLGTDIELSASMNVASGKNFTLDLNGHVLKAAANNRVVYVNSGATLTITDGNPTAEHKYVVGSDGLWTWNDAASGIVVAYEDLTERPAAGTVVVVKGGAITGGNADSNNGGGIYSSGTVNLNGGYIVGNKAYKCGGVYMNPGSFNMAGGGIIGNRSTYSGDDGYGGGGVYVRSGNFNMTNGYISHNYCSSNGGGVFVWTGNFNFSAGNISYNYCVKDGGGVYFGDKDTGEAVFTMSGTAKIINNTSGRYGGGVSTNTKGSVKLLGGEISGNKSNVKSGNYIGGGVEVWSSKNKVTVGGDIKITGNTDKDGNENNVFLDSKNTLIVSTETPLTTDASIGVNTMTAPTTTTPVDVTTLNSTDYKAYFTSDKAAYYIANEANVVKLMLAETLSGNLTPGTLSGTYFIKANTTLTIPNGVTVILTGDITNTTPENFIIEDGGQLITIQTGIKANVKEKIEDNKWWTISSNINENILTTNVTNLVSENDYELYYYRESDHLWINAQHPEDHWNTVKQGMGYLYGFDHEGTEPKNIHFKGEIEVGEVSINLTAESEDKLIGFNLLGNPYTHDITMKDNIEFRNTADEEIELAGCYILENSEWLVCTPTDAIAKNKGFLVQVPENVTATFRNNMSPAKSRGNDMDEIEINVTNSQYKDRAYAMFGDNNGLEKMGRLSDETPVLYIPQNGTNYAIAMMDNNVETFDLYFEAQTDDIFTITMKDNCYLGYLHLYDRLTGIDTDMLGSSYTFNGSPSDPADRFKVVLSENANVSDGDSFAYQSGTDLIINGEGTLQIIDMLGRVMMNKQVSHERVSVSGFNTGAYIVRLIGNEVRTEKIILK